jgi:formate/nitrite transporter
MQDRLSDRKMAGSPQSVTFDAILPAAIALRAEESGVKRAALSPVTVLVLAILGGAFISFGAIFATTVYAGNITAIGADGSVAFSAGLPYGITRLVTGLAFALGLILVALAGAELFTGNNLIVMAWASGKVRTRDVFRNWAIVFAGNFIGAFSTAVIMFATTQYTFGGGAVGLAALSTAHAKTSLAFVPALTLGIMCNALVCLSVWMCFGARTNIDKIVTIIPPISGFVAAGFEHCIANIYYIPLGLFIKAGAPDSFWVSIHKTPGDFPALTWHNFLVVNLLPVTIGNIIGGAVMVGAVYWFIYLRGPAKATRAQADDLGAQRDAVGKKSIA